MRTILKCAKTLTPDQTTQHVQVFPPPTIKSSTPSAATGAKGATVTTADTGANLIEIKAIINEATRPQGNRDRARPPHHRHLRAANVVLHLRLPRQALEHLSRRQSLKMYVLTTSTTSASSTDSDRVRRTGPTSKSKKCVAVPHHSSSFSRVESNEHDL